jgi:hypothetical protein
MSLLRFYPEATPGKKEHIENDDEKQKKKKNHPNCFHMGFGLLMISNSRCSLSLSNRL